MNAPWKSATGDISITKAVGIRLITSLMVAILTGGVSAYISVQIISGEVKTLSDNQHQIAATQQIQFQELSSRIDTLADRNKP